ncbi:MAG: VOC family protein [Candidatus Eremiobacteraeota bacterium]|nr:VOC family protein [Candidatus Eremiobacteraeota bacterium]
MLEVTDIAFTAYPARDVAALARFYRESLGIAFDEPYAENGVALYCEARVGSGYFSIMTAAWIGVAPGSSASIAFEVADIEAAFAALRERGIATEEIHVTPVCKLGSFTDPEGNKVTLHESTVTP